MGDSQVYYPIFLDLKGRPCLVVGGGSVGERKVRGLLQAEGRVTVVSPVVTAGLEALFREGRIAWIHRAFRPDDLGGSVLVFAATDDESVNRRVVQEARALGAWANAAQSTVPSDFVVPAILRRGPLQIGVSTGGNSPAYAQMVRDRLYDLLGPEHEELISWLGELREQIQTTFSDAPQKRRAVWKAVVTWSTVELVRQGKWDQIEEKVNTCLLSLSD
ncbi:MAG: bifunctional precorrin-2 dehydrogenase/sirohydrochlorin ferrochelatase [bacterium]|nr:bifunctional precorrin-2 dehydrogenase/sirohydrochlorin ferrochelatase [bacterium]